MAQLDEKRGLHRIKRKRSGCSSAKGEHQQATAISDRQGIALNAMQAKRKEFQTFKHMKTFRKRNKAGWPTSESQSQSVIPVPGCGTAIAAGITNQSSQLVPYGVPHALRNSALLVKFTPLVICRSYPHVEDVAGPSGPTKQPFGTRPMPRKPPE